MSEIVKLRTRADIDEEAATWIWRMDSAAIDAADRQAFEAWQRQDPRHRRAVSELSAVWDALDGLADAKREEKIATFANTANAACPHHPQRWWIAAAAQLPRSPGPLPKRRLPDGSRRFARQTSNFRSADTRRYR